MTAEDLLAIYGYETMDAYLAETAEDIKYYEKVYLTVQAVCEKEGFEASEENMKEYFSYMFGTEDYSDYTEIYGEPYLKSIVVRDVMLKALIENMEVAPATAE